MIYLKKQGSAAYFHAEATPDENCLHRETFANAFQKPAVNTPKLSENHISTNPPVQTINVVSDASAPGTDTRSKDRIVQRDHILEQVASSRPSIHGTDRGVVVKRCPPEAILDPLSTFMMLRAEQKEKKNTLGFYILLYTSYNFPKWILAVSFDVLWCVKNSSLELLQFADKRHNFFSDLLNFWTAPRPNRQTPQLRPAPGQMHESGKRLTYTVGAVSENVTRAQESACQSTEEVSSQLVNQSVSQYRRDVQATGITHSTSSLHTDAKTCSVKLPCFWLLKSPSFLRCMLISRQPKARLLGAACVCRAFSKVCQKAGAYFARKGRL